jgi:hypothetical protein
MRHLLVLLTMVPLAACASSSLKLEDSAKVEPTVDVVEPPSVKPEPDESKAEPVAIRNQGFGPYDSLDLVCGSGEAKRCEMSEPAALPGGASVIAVASFSEGRDGRAHLAVQRQEGWYVSEVPDGKVLGMLSHHSPAGTFFDLKHARALGTNGFSIDRRYGASSFIGGRGSDGSSSMIEVKRLSCTIDGGKVSCDEGKLLYSQFCQTPMEGGQQKCETKGTEPAPF